MRIIEASEYIIEVYYDPFEEKFPTIHLPRITDCAFPNSSREAISQNVDILTYSLAAFKGGPIWEPMGVIYVRDGYEYIIEEQRNPQSILGGPIRRWGASIMRALRTQWKRIRVGGTPHHLSEPPIRRDGRA